MNIKLNDKGKSELNKSQTHNYHSYQAVGGGGGGAGWVLA